MSARPRVLEFAVALDDAWDATGDRGGTPLPGAEREAWTPEHLVLVALCRCVLTSLAFHLQRAGLEATSRASAHGAVTRREEDGRFAFVAIEVDLDVRLGGPLDAAARDDLLRRAERGCFVGASLTAHPVYRWTVDGEVAG